MVQQVPAENPQNIPAIETDGRKCYLLDQVLNLGPDYKNFEKLRQIWEREYTLDIHTLEVLRALARGVNIKVPTLLEGPTAATKSSAIEYLALLTGHKYYRINLKGQTDASELLGKFVPNPNAKAGEAPLMWQDGLLVKAMKEGAWVILDEINLAEPQILEAINSVLEKYPSVTLTDNGGVKIGPGGEYEVHPNFRIFATMNPGYTGRRPFSPAFQNRWTNRVHVGAPTKFQLEAMLLHHTFGKQPSVQYQGERYESERSETAPQMEKVRSLNEVGLLTFFTRLATFHEAISKMAEKQDIGRDLDPGHFFTRRDLSTLLDYIATASSFSRHKKETRDITTHPVEIILEAMKMVYLDKMSGDDRKKVEKLIKISKLNEAELKKLFELDITRTRTRTSATGAGSPPEPLPPNPPSPEPAPEITEVQAELQLQYQHAIETLQFYGKKDPETEEFQPLLQEDPENPGTYFYEADYDGSGETAPDPMDTSKRIENPAAENFSGKRFDMPTFTEVLSWLTVDQVKLYKEMKEQGLEPQLQLTPIALSIRTMGQMIDAKRDELEINTSDTYVWDGIKDHELIYEADGFKAREDGKKLEITGGKSKSQWIHENQGWIIDIVATKQNLEADEDKKTILHVGRDGRSEEVELTNAEKVEKYMADSKLRGYHGLGYETYLTAQMGGLRNRKPLEEQYFTVLPDSSLTNPDIIAYGDWNDDYVHLDGDFADTRNVNLRYRRSVRVRKFGV